MVGITTTQLRDIALWNEFSGRIEASRSVFTVDDRPYRATLRRAQADLLRARSRARLARVEANRGDTLSAADAIPRAENDGLRASAAQAVAERESAKAQVTLTRLDVEFSKVKAPIAGRAGRSLVSVGDYVAAGPAPTLLTTVVSTAPVYVYFTYDEQTYLRFASHAEHSPVETGLTDETGFAHAGTVDFVDNRVDETTGTVLVRAVVDNLDNRLTPSLFVRVRMTEGQTVKMIAIDGKAFLTDQDRQYVYVLGEPGRNRAPHPGPLHRWSAEVPRLRCSSHPEACQRNDESRLRIDKSERSRIAPNP